MGKIFKVANRGDAREESYHSILERLLKKCTELIGKEGHIINTDLKRMEDMVDLIIPVYLDVNVLLDLLASIEDVFALVEKISSRNVTENMKESSMGTEFGIANILNLLKINLSAEREKYQTEKSKEERSLERYHTYGSLLYRLRSNLISNNLVRSFSNNVKWSEVKPSDFVEIRGTFCYNPLAEVFLSIEELIKFFIPDSDISQALKHASKDKHKVKDEIKTMELLGGIISQLHSSLELGNVYTFIVQINDDSGYKAIITLFKEYLRDKSKRELINGEFKVLGKVVRNISNINEGPIDLFKGTRFSILGEEFTDQLLTTFSQLGEKGFNIPEIKRRIDPLALQILPIAIYI